MKTVALIIGFEYIKSEDWKSLPGIPVDMYQAYTYSQNITKNITVFTDVDKDYRTSVLRQAIIDGYVDSNLLSFIEDTQDKNHHVLYQSQKVNNYITNNFEDTIIDSIRGTNRLFVYYTGHAKNGHLILPDNTHVPLNHLRNIIISNISSNSQVVIILDCCQSNGMELPYIYNNNYKLNNFDFLPNRIICLSSSSIDQHSTATRSGSIFTRELFKILNSNNTAVLTVRDLFNKITVNIYTTYLETTLFVWFCNPTKDNNIDIMIDMTNSIIKVTLNNCQNTIETSASIRDYIRYLSKLDYRTDVNPIK